MSDSPDRQINPKPPAAPSGDSGQRDTGAPVSKTAALVDKDKLGTLSQWQLIKMRFLRHRLAVAGLILVVVLYVMAIFAEFFAVSDPNKMNTEYIYCPPQLPKVSLKHGIYIHPMERQIHPVTLKNYYIENRDEVIPLTFFAVGEPAKLMGFIPWNRHFMGVDHEAYARLHPEKQGEEPPPFFFFGADQFGQDIYSRIIHGSRISLSIGVVSIIITFFVGITLGGISGYLSGKTDIFIQRLIEIINAFPQLPLWLALAAIMPQDWSPLQVYFAITVVLALLQWTSLARVVRGKILSLREEDYAVAARLLGASHARIIFLHLLPGFTSHIIVSLTLTIPMMILGETSLSFLGLGLRPPVVSWGVMLQDCFHLQVVENYPWLLMPVIMIILTVLSFNFLGDGLRDAADPYSN